ncbi:MAG: YggT family protein [Bdellovibrionales bacterium]|nr:YggT family protein [Bdellovibrionales bacterium]
MILLGRILIGIGRLLDGVLFIATILVVARAVVSWVNADPYNGIVRFLRSSTDPLLRPIQRYIPPVGGGIDLSPMILIFALFFLRQVLAGTLVDYGMKILQEAQMSPLFS